MNNISTQPRDDVPAEIDVLLHSYFQTEMPNPWPGFKAPKQTRMKRPGSVWSRYSGRIALAACITLLVAGYLTLGGFFPGPQASSGVEQVMPDVASKDGGSKPNPAKAEKNQKEDPAHDRLEPMGNDTNRRPK